jgi:hypothetical protein
MALASTKDKSLDLWQIYDDLVKNEKSFQKSALEAQLYRSRKNYPTAVPVTRPCAPLD